MARPLKQGVDYFPLDVHIDNKLKFIIIKFGYEGFGILIRVLSHVYSVSYWCSATEDDLLLLSDDLKIDVNFLNEVIKEALHRGIFNKELYEKHEILTSKGIQKRYKEIVKRRQNVEIIEEYLLIDDNFGVNAYNNQVNVDTMHTLSKHDVRKSTQRKGKEIERKKKVKNPPERFIPTLSEVEDYFFENGYTKEHAKKVFNYYQESIRNTPNAIYWKDSTGKKVLSWRMKLQSVWMKDEGKIQVYNERGFSSSAKQEPIPVQLPDFKKNDLPITEEQKKKAEKTIKELTKNLKFNYE